MPSSFALLEDVLCGRDMAHAHKARGEGGKEKNVLKSGRGKNDRDKVIQGDCDSKEKNHSFCREIYGSYLPLSFIPVRTRVVNPFSLHSRKGQGRQQSGSLPTSLPHDISAVQQIKEEGSPIGSRTHRGRGAAILSRTFFSLFTAVSSQGKRKSMNPFLLLREKREIFVPSSLL